MNFLKYSVFVFSFVLIFGGIQTVYGHGLGTVESDVLFFNDSFFKVKVQTTPDVLSGDESSIGFKISTINDDQNTLVSNVKYNVKIFDTQTGHQILSFNAYSPDDSFHATIIPDSDVLFLGNSDDNDAWIGSVNEPLEIHAPIFLQVVWFKLMYLFWKLTPNLFLKIQLLKLY